jgi:Bacterial Ig-like domain (group 3)/FG-GAP-like repeat
MERKTVRLCLTALVPMLVAVAPARADQAPDPRFVPSHVGDAGSVPVATAIGDVTGDGRPDLIVANGGGGAAGTNHRVVVFAQKVDGTLPSKPTFSVKPSAASGAYRLGIGDLDGDGKGDLAVAAVDGQPAPGIDIFLESNGILTGPTTLGPIAIRDLAVGDTNGDGLADLIYTRNGAPFAVAVRRQLLLGGFGGETVIAADVQSTGLSLGDVDGDGLTDLAIDGAANETADVFVQDPLLHTFARSSVPLPAAVTRSFLADVNHDGHADLVVAETGSGLAWAPGAGDGTFGSFTSVGGPTSLAKEVGDLNDDGLVDLATFAKHKLRVYVQQTGGGLSPACVFPANGVTGGDAATSIGDLNGDGGADLAGAEGAGLAGAATVFTQLMGGDTLPMDLSLVASASKVATGSSVTLSGTLSNPDGGCALTTGTVTIHQRDPNDVTSVVDTVPLDGDLGFTIDVQPASVGSYTFWATWDGDATHEAATSANLDVAVGDPTSLSLTVSASTVVYGHAVTLRSTLTGSTGSPTISFYRIVDGVRTKLHDAVADGDGVATLTITPSRNASYQARFAGSTGLLPSSSPTREVDVRVVVVGSMVRYDAFKDGVAIYDCCKAYYRFLVKPKHPGGIVRVSVQYLAGGRWHALPSEIDTFKLGPDGTDQIFLHVAGGKGYRFRVRSHFAADGDHLGAWSPYVRFRFR